MFADLKARSLAARKAKDSQTLTFLSTLIGDLQANAKLVDGEKVVTDDAALAMVRKFLKGVNETLVHTPDNADVLFEKELLEGLLPTQMTAEELKVAVSQIIMGNDGNLNMGQVMKALKYQYNGRYDGRIASEIVKGAL